MRKPTEKIPGFLLGSRDFLERLDLTGWVALVGGQRDCDKGNGAADYADNGRAQVEGLP